MSENRTVAVGTLNGVFLAARFNADGTVDSSFNQFRGPLVLDLGGADDEAFAVAVQPDGNLVVAGRGNGDFTVVRLSADGVPDGATRFIDINGVDTARAVALQSTGMIVVAGDSVGSTNGEVRRLNADLTVDPTYAASVDGGGTETLRGIAVYPAGSAGADKVVVVGGTDATNGGDIAAVGAGTTAAGVAEMPSTGRLVVVGANNGATDSFAARLFGRTELPTQLAVGGSTNGVVQAYGTSNATGYNTTPLTTLTPVGGVAVNTAVADVNADGVPDLISGVTSSGDRVVVQDGRVVGTWKRTVTRSQLRVTVSLFKGRVDDLGAPARRSLDQAVAAFGRYTGRTATLEG